MSIDKTKDTSQYAGLDGDLIQFNLEVPYNCLNNETVQELQKAGKHSDEQLNLIGLVEYLVEHHGHHYGPFLIQALHVAMSFDGHVNPLQAIKNEEHEMIDLYRQTYASEAALR